MDNQEVILKHDGSIWIVLQELSDERILVKDKKFGSTIEAKKDLFVPVTKLD